ncbi:MAG: hypothetical protein ACE15C_03230 [Phycisphaerae bacterium]
MGESAKMKVVGMTTAKTFALMHPDRPVGWHCLAPRPLLIGHAEGFAGVKVEFTSRKALGGVIVQAKITNSGRRPVGLRAIRWATDLSRPEASPAMRFPKTMAPCYFATENYRGDYFGTGTTRGDHYFKPLPHEMVTLGFSEDLVFPGLFIGSESEQVGMFCAAASRGRMDLMFRLWGGDGQTTWNFEIDEHPQGLDAIVLRQGESLTGERIFFAVVDTGDPQQATDGYYKVLERGGYFARQKHNPLPRQRIWGSWNFGYFANITEADVLKQLPVISRRFPMVKFVQIDHGYERVYASGQRAQIDLLYKTDRPYDAGKFPGGPAELVRKIKAAGLRPATWLGLWAAGTSPMIQEHPDWILLDETGHPQVYFTGLTNPDIGPLPVYPLDPSVPAVRKYIEHVCRTVFGDWGFEGVKLDFYSFAFCIRRARFRHGNQTAAQYERWMMDTFRRWMPRDGFLGPCSVAGTGTPLFAPGADYFRCAEDISEGQWEIAKRIAAWCANTNMLLQRRPVLVNADSIGWGPKFNPREWETFLNLVTITGGALEIGGDLTQLDDAKIDRLNLALKLSDPLRRVRCLDVPRGKVVWPPSVWVSLGDGGNDDIMAAVFNWTDEPASIDVRTLGELSPGWTSRLRPLLPVEGAEITSDTICLPPHASVYLRDGGRP